MERTVGIEEARGRLGELADEVAGGSDPVVLSRRGIARAMLIDRDKYLRFKVHQSREDRAELERLLVRVETQMEHVGLDRSSVREALEIVRRLD